MTTDYGSRKKKQDQMVPEWPAEVKFKPTENKDLTHAYEYIQGINSLITYYNSAKADIQVQNKGTWVQQFQNFEKQVPPDYFQQKYDIKMANQINKNQKGNYNQKHYEEKEDSEIVKQNKKHSIFVNTYRSNNKNNIQSQRVRFQITKNQTQAINNFQFYQDNDSLEVQNKLNIFDRKHFTMNKILEKVTDSLGKATSISKKKQHYDINKTQQAFLKQDDQFKQKKNEDLQLNIKDHKKNSIQINKKQNILGSYKNQKLQEIPQKQRSDSLQMLQSQTQLQDDNKYHNQGLRLDLSEKTKNKLEEFENKIKDYCYSIKI